MIYQIGEVMRDVRVCIDQNMSSERLIEEGDIDTLSVDDIIESKICEAVSIVHRSAPPHVLEGMKEIGDDVYWKDGNSGSIRLPGDFMRLIAFEMSDWDISVTEAISEHSTAYKLQRQPIKSLRGTPHKPVCAITNHRWGLDLEFYSCKSQEAEVKKGLYMPWPKVDDEGGIDISEKCYRAAVYTAAALTLTTLGEAEKSAALRQTAQQTIE